MSGFLRHTLHPGETSLESQEKWGKAIYPAGLLLLAGTAILLGFWGWNGARTIGLWWLATGFLFLALRFLIRISPGNISGQWIQIFPLGWLYSLLFAIYNFLHRIADIFTTSLEGEGGLLWSFLLLVLIISILSTRGQ